MRWVNKIILHCSATKAGQEFHISDIRAWHQKRGFYDVGYHYVVTIDGEVEKGREINHVGAHCYGQNQHSIGVCYIGGLDVDGKPADTRTEAQKQALGKLLSELVARFHVPVYGHRDFAKKDCPCFDARSEYAHLYGALRNLNSAMKK